MKASELGRVLLASGEFLYLPDEVQQAYIVTQEECDLLDSEYQMADGYSEWCSATGREATEQETAEAYTLTGWRGLRRPAP